MLLIQLFVSHSATANVSEVETDPITINKTEVTDSTVGGGKGDAGELPWWKKLFNKIGDIKDSTIDGLKDFGKSIADGFKEFKGWAGDRWDEFTDWASDKWNKFTDWAGNTWDAVTNWFANNKWAQTILAAIIAIGVILGGIAILAALGVVGAISLAVVAVVAVGALIGAFVYQWIAGDSYSFWGALGSAGLGGLLGYIGFATGAFATAFAWLKNKAVPAALSWMKNTAWPWIVGKGQAALNWIRTTAWPWVLGKGRAAWTWMKTAAWPWLRGKAIAGWSWLKGKGLTLWSSLKGFYTTSNLIKFILKGAYFGFFGGAAGSVISNLFSGEEFTIWGILQDAVIGGIGGALMGPIMLSGQTIGWSIIGVIGIYGGMENLIVEGVRDGEWTFENFLTGLLISGASAKFIGLFVEKALKDLNNDHINETVIKGVEETIKWGYDELKESLKGISENGNTGDSNNPGETNKSGNSENQMNENPSNTESKEIKEVPNEVDYQESENSEKSHNKDERLEQKINRSNSIKAGSVRAQLLEN